MRETSNSNNGVKLDRMSLLLGAWLIVIVAVEAPVHGNELRFSDVCPIPPEQVVQGTISLYMREALEPPGVICIRATNGLDVDIDMIQLVLQRQKKESPSTGEFWVLESSLRRDGVVIFEPRMTLARGENFDWRLPKSGETVPPGTYRACLSYTLPGVRKIQVICSEKLSLPSSPPGCPPFPTSKVNNRVTVSTVKSLDMPGVVCIRVINGLKVGIEYGGKIAFRLQIKQGTQKTKIYLSPFSTKDPSQKSNKIIMFRGAHSLRTKRSIDEYLPGFGNPAPPGRYKACFRFRMPGQSIDDEICSEEFFLP